jgi:c-di-GMP-binding flagellar brake protein YcgR
VRLPKTDEQIELLCPRFPNMRFPSRVQRVQDKYLVVSAPFVGGAPLHLRPNEQVVLRWHENYLLIAAALQHVRGSLSVKLEVLEAPSCQRRNYFRWSIALPLHFMHSRTPNHNWLATRTLDISGGGLCFVWRKTPEQPLYLNDCLNVRISFEQRPLQAAGRIVGVRCSPATTSSHMVAVEFTRIREADRSRIIRYIFRRQCAARHSS